MEVSKASYPEKDQELIDRKLEEVFEGSTRPVDLEDAEEVIVDEDSAASSAAPFALRQSIPPDEARPVEPNARLRQILARYLAVPPETIQFSYGKHGKPLLFGPGSILDAHTDHEKISKRDLAAAVETYKRMVMRLKESGS